LFLNCIYNKLFYDKYEWFSYFETEANLVKRLVELNKTYVKKVLSDSREGIDNVQSSTPNIDLSLDEFEDW